MIIDKIPWLHHDGKAPIFSIDVDSTGKRLVTGGQDSKVRIWNTEAILHEEKELDEATPKLLATISVHSGAVNIVRFTPARRSGSAQAGPVKSLLASGSDDQKIIIYERVEGSGRPAFGSNDAPSIENWKPFRTLGGHSNNVVDIAWSPNGKMLASASLDNLVIVWDVIVGSPLATLRAHQGYVQGVAWDPFNKYLATQGEKDGVFIWSIGQWEAPIFQQTQTLVKNPSTTFNTRLGWSPDGQTLSAVHGYDKKWHTAPQIERGRWESQVSLAGHRAPITVARFSPNFVHKRGDPSSEELCTVVALGSKDKTFSVWIRGEPEPLLSVDRPFTQGVMDMAWMPDGLGLFACSYDGSVVSLRFHDLELGRIASAAEVKELIHMLYRGNTEGAAVCTLTPSIEAAKLAAAAQMVGVPGTGRPTAAAAAVGSSVPSLPAPRRIQATPVNTSSMSAAGVAEPSSSGRPAAENPATGAAAPGPRRLTPTQVGGPAPQPSSVAATSASQDRPAREAAVPTTSLLVPPPSKRIALTAAAAAAPSPSPNMQQPNQHTAVSTSAPVDPSKLRPQVVSTLMPVPPVLPVLTYTVLLPAVAEGAPTSKMALTAENRKVALGSMAMERAGQLTVVLRCSKDGVLLWTDTMTSGHASILRGNIRFLAVATSTGELQVYSHAGRKLLPSIPLGSPVAHMELEGWPTSARSGATKGNSAVPAETAAAGSRSPESGWKLLVVTVDGNMHMWDLRLRACLLQGSMLPLLQQMSGHGTRLPTGASSPPSPLVAAVRLTSSGVPLVVFEDQRGFSYDAAMRCWMKVADPDMRASVHFTTLAPLVQGDLAMLQYEANRQHGRPAGLLLPAFTPAEEQQRQELSHLEVQMSAALSMRSPAEYKRWLIAYVRKLSADCDKQERLVEVMDELFAVGGMATAGTAVDMDVSNTTAVAPHHHFAGTLMAATSVPAAIPPVLQVGGLLSLFTPLKCQALYKDVEKEVMRNKANFVWFQEVRERHRTLRAAAREPLMPVEAEVANSPGHLSWLQR
ncbi:hypothetical protein CEUSTIGMA_g1118.t1 [Chlamydomonas eustigma]|uniref:Protein HIRA n=1 Tax=Chlamydomonas eustigma TaxID=1157962 RepID=A0A250WS41_9CHLO|nr:hypothetical protein CEUSTIGMA_g1118.t1 [Chlamydomonas eustigma]|eukprot:GAX73667.1 hypothetical protein CEUSTIGMA_g1118.t1 [Chlamydomonas eustigma]